MDNKVTNQDDHIFYVNKIKDLKKLIITYSTRYNYLSSTIPDFYFDPIDSIDEFKQDYDHNKEIFPLNFHIFCSLVSPIRCLEILKYVNFKSFADYFMELNKLLKISGNLSVKDNSQKPIKFNAEKLDLVKFSLFGRILVEQTAYFYDASNKTEKIIDELMPVLKNTKELSNEFFYKMSHAFIQLETLINPSSIDIEKSINKFSTHQDVSIDKNNPRKPQNILTKLQKLEKEIPSTHALYSSFSEILHPNHHPFWSNSFPKFRKNVKGYNPVKGYNFKESSLRDDYRFGEFLSVVISPKLISFISEQSTLLKKIKIKQDNLEKKLRRILIPIARSYVKSQLDFKEVFTSNLNCPCGSKKQFISCCGGYIKIAN